MLIGEPNAEELAEEIVARGLNVREVEAMARERATRTASKQTNRKRARRSATKAPMRWRSKNACPMRLGLVVSIDDRDGGRHAHASATQPRTAR